jgi:hypothetical protein
MGKMCNLKNIKELLSDKYKSQNKDLLLENNYDSKGKKFTVKYNIVKNASISYELYKFDNTAFPFFNDISKLKLMCDYFLFAEERNSLFIFLIELKSGKESAKQQLDAAEVFANYIKYSAIRIGIKIDNIHIRKIRICEEKIKRRRTRTDKDLNFDYTETNYCDYQWSTLYLEPLMRY